jgi:DNA-binding NtrC family response regulator
MGMGRTLLLVEDDPGVLSALASLLEASGGDHILVASNIDKALHFLSTFVVNVLITDATLQPPHHGMELFSPAVANNPDIAIVLMSAEQIGDLGDLPSRVLYIKKPFGREHLFDSIKEATDRAAARPSGTL